MAAVDAIQGRPHTVDSPARKGFAITKSDDNELAFITTAIYVGGAGDIAVVLANDTDPITFKAVPVGTTLRIRARKVMSTNTTATLLLGLH